METKNHPCGSTSFGCRHNPKLCPDRKKHLRHDWVTATLDVWHCQGRSYVRRRCDHGKYGNMQCLLKVGHKGDHCPPCVEASAHRAHQKEDAGGRLVFDAKGRPYMCKGRMFDHT